MRTSMGKLIMAGWMAGWKQQVLEKKSNYNF